VARSPTTTTTAGRVVTALVLSVHVVAAIVLIGPVTVATSAFPPVARAAVSGPGSDTSLLWWLHRTSRVYAVLGLVVPVFGVATALRMGVLGQAWLLVAIALTAVAVAVLFAAVLPTQRRLLDLVDPAAAGRDTVARLVARASATAGVFALLWVVVTILMIVRPGSTTGV
jgi:hypothetical protein